MKKLLILTLLIVLCMIVAGVYGILHDQLTYTISPEYYTRFKFYQFELVDGAIGDKAIIQNPRLAVAAVGFMATWWMGILIGFCIGLTGLFHESAAVMFKRSIKAVIIVIALTAVIGAIGLAYGKFYVSGTTVNWWLPANLADRESFIMVGSVHNFSYLGGAIGMLGGLIYQIITARKHNPNFQNLLSGFLYFGLRRKPRT